MIGKILGINVFLDFCPDKILGSLVSLADAARNLLRHAAETGSCGTFLVGDGRCALISGFAIGTRLGRAIRATVSFENDVAQRAGKGQDALR